MYANKSADSVIFKQDLETLATQNANFTYKSFTGETERISIEDLKPHTNAHFYICGPDGLKSGMSEHLKNLKVDKEKINVEHYADGYVPWFGLV